MYINHHSRNKVIAFFFNSLIFFLAFDFIFAFTIYKSQLLIYIFMIFNLLSFVYCALRYGVESNVNAKMWALFLCFHIASLTFNGNISTIPYWIVSLIILFLPSRFAMVFKPDIFIFIGLFFAGGVFFQYLYPNLYMNLIFPLFINDASDFIESSIVNEFGFSGFSPQTGATAYILLICQSVLLAFWNENYFLKKKLFKYLILAIFILAIFLTGKRMHSLISIIVFFASIYVYGSSNKIRKLFMLLFLFLGCFVCIQYFISNVDVYSDNVFLKRFASSYSSASGGEDVTSGRTLLYQKAWSFFEQQPILGVGAGNFVKLGGQRTAVHNTYLQVLCEEGVLRFALFILPLLMIFFKTIWTIKRTVCTDTSSFLILSFFIQVIFILYSFTGNTIENYSNFVLYFMGVSFYTFAKNKKFCIV